MWIVEVTRTECCNINDRKFNAVCYSILKHFEVRVTVLRRVNDGICTVALEKSSLLFIGNLTTSVDHTVVWCDDEPRRIWKRVLVKFKVILRHLSGGTEKNTINRCQRLLCMHWFVVRRSLLRLMLYVL